MCHYVMLIPFPSQSVVIQHWSIQQREEKEIPIWQHYRDYRWWWAALIWDALGHLSALKAVISAALSHPFLF